MRKTILDTLAALEQDGTLTAAQRSAVEQRLTAALAPSDARGWLGTVVAGLGAVLVAAGLLYLVGYHWEELTKTTKLTVVFGVWFALHFAGWWTSAPHRSPGLGSALTLLAVLSFGGAIGLVGQIYHLTSHYPNALLAWWALNVPVLLWNNTRAVQLGVTSVFLVWCPWHQSVYVADAGTYWRWQSLALGLLASGGAAWFLGLAGSVEGSRWQKFAEPWRLIGIACAALGPFLLGFQHAAGATFEQAIGSPAWWASRPLHGGLLLATLGAGLAALAHRSHFRARATWLLALQTALCMALLAGFPAAVPLAANVLQLVGIVLAVHTGIRQHRPGLVNAAIGWFALVVFVRYVEHLWDKLAGAYAFLGLGALLLCGGWFLERQRRVLVARSREMSA